MIKNRTCIICQKLKPIIEFRNLSIEKDWHSTICRRCEGKRWNDFVALNPESKRKRYLSRKTWDRNNRDKTRVHLRLHRLLKKGLIKKPNECSCCGEKARIEAHHNNYEITDDVVWLCSSCHRLTHTGGLIEQENLKMIGGDV